MNAEVLEDLKDRTRNFVLRVIRPMATLLTIAKKAKKRSNK